MNAVFEGVWVPIVTPFRRAGVDHEALAKLARHLQSQGVQGLVAGATTGEGALLEPGEPEAILASLRRAAPALPVVVGVSSPSTAQAVNQVRAFNAHRPDGYLVTPPTYVRPTQAGVQRHFEAVAQAADAPILVYNIPYRTGVAVELDTLAALSTDARIAGIKECGGSVERLQRLLTETPLKVLSGDDALNFTALCLGGHGSIAASAHVLPHWHVRMHQLLQRGQLESARRIANALAPMIRLLFAEPNPAPLKAWLAQQGWCEAELRLPFQLASPALAEQVAKAWDALADRVRADAL